MIRSSSCIMYVLRLYTSAFAPASTSDHLLKHEQFVGGHRTDCPPNVIPWRRADVFLSVIYCDWPVGSWWPLDDQRPEGEKSEKFISFSLSLSVHSWLFHEVIKETETKEGGKQKKTENPPMIKRRDMWQPCQNSPQVVQTRLAEVRPKIRTRDVCCRFFLSF